METRVGVRAVMGRLWADATIVGIHASRDLRSIVHNGLEAADRCSLLQRSQCTELTH